MIGLSTSSLSLFSRCEKCFWLDKNKKVKIPRGIMPSLPGGMDRVMKAQVEVLIAAGNPVPALSAIAGAAPFADRARLELFRSWRTFQRVIDLGEVGVTAWGELDDLIEYPETGMVSPFDFKTKGTEPDEEYGRKYYQTQVDMYHLILEGQGLKCDGKGYLSYGWPDRIDAEGRVIFGWKTLVLDTDPARAQALLAQAAHCLMGPEPLASLTCEYCAFHEARSPKIESVGPANKSPAKAKWK